MLLSLDWDNCSSHLIMNYYFSSCLQNIKCILHLCILVSAHLYRLKLLLPLKWHTGTWLDHEVLTFSSTLLYTSSYVLTLLIIWTYPTLYKCTIVLVMMWFIFINSGVDYHFHTFYVFIEIYQLMYEMLDIQRKLWFRQNYLPASSVPSEISKMIGKPSVNFMKCQLHLWGFTDGLNSSSLDFEMGEKLHFSQINLQHYILFWSYVLNTIPSWQILLAVGTKLLLYFLICF